MANKITDTSNYSAIANSIRSKLNTQSTYTPSQMAAAIDSIPVTDIEALSVTDNGTYTAPTGTAYNPVTVNVSGGGGGEAEDAIIERTISGAYSNRTAKSIGSYAFGYCSSLAEANFPNAKSIGNYAFVYCSRLAEANFPNATSIGSYAFGSCYHLIRIDISLVSSVPRLVASNAFSSTPIGGYSISAGQYGSIFVPASLYEAFQTASNWSYFSSRMVSV